MQQQHQNASSAGPNHPPQGPHPPHSDSNNDGMQWAAPQMQQQQQQWGGPNLPRQQTLPSQPLADPGQEVEMTDVRKVFHLPCEEAAVALGVAHSRLKRACRRLGVLRWPQRKLASLSFLQDAVEKDVRMNQDDQRMVLKKIKFEYDAVVVDPNRPIDPELEALRLNLWKLKHYIKRKAAKQGGDGDPIQPGQHGVHAGGGGGMGNGPMHMGGHMPRGGAHPSGGPYTGNNDGGMDLPMQGGHGGGHASGHSPRKRQASNRPDTAYDGGWAMRGGSGGHALGREDDLMGGGNNDGAGDSDRERQGRGDSNKRPQHFDRRNSGELGVSRGGLDDGSMNRAGGGNNNHNNYNNNQRGAMGFAAQGDALGGPKVGDRQGSVGSWGGPGSAGGWRPGKEQGKAGVLSPHHHQPQHPQLTRLASGLPSMGSSQTQQGPFPAGQAIGGPRQFGNGDPNQYPDHQQGNPSDSVGARMNALASAAANSDQISRPDQGGAPLFSSAPTRMQGGGGGGGQAPSQQDQQGSARGGAPWGGREGQWNNNNINNNSGAWAQPAGATPPSHAAAFAADPMYGEQQRDGLQQRHSNGGNRADMLDLQQAALGLGLAGTTTQKRAGAVGARTPLPPSRSGTPQATGSPPGSQGSLPNNNNATSWSNGSRKAPSLMPSVLHRNSEDVHHPGIGPQRSRVGETVRHHSQPNNPTQQQQEFTSQPQNRSSIGSIPSMEPVQQRSLTPNPNMNANPAFGGGYGNAGEGMDLGFSQQHPSQQALQGGTDTGMQASWAPDNQGNNRPATNYVGMQPNAGRNGPGYYPPNQQQVVSQGDYSGQPQQQQEYGQMQQQLKRLMPALHSLASNQPTGQLESRGSGPGQPATSGMQQQQMGRSQSYNGSGYPPLMQQQQPPVQQQHARSTSLNVPQQQNTQSSFPQQQQQQQQVDGLAGTAQGGGGTDQDSVTEVKKLLDIIQRGGGGGPPGSSQQQQAMGMLQALAQLATGPAQENQSNSAVNNSNPAAHELSNHGDMLNAASAPWLYQQEPAGNGMHQGSGMQGGGGGGMNIRQDGGQMGWGDRPQEQQPVSTTDILQHLQNQNQQQQGASQQWAQPPSQDAWARPSIPQRLASDSYDAQGGMQSMRWQPQQPQQMYVQAQQQQQQMYATQQQQPGYDRMESHHPQDAGQFARMAPTNAPAMHQQHHGSHHLPLAAVTTSASHFPDVTAASGAAAALQEDSFLVGPMAPLPQAPLVPHRAIKKEGRDTAAPAAEMRAQGDSFESRGDGGSSAAADTGSDEGQEVGLAGGGTNSRASLEPPLGSVSQLVVAQPPPARRQYNLNSQRVVSDSGIDTALEAVGSSCGGLLGTAVGEGHVSVQKLATAGQGPHQTLGGDGAVIPAVQQQQACPHVLPPLSSWSSIAEAVANEADPVHELGTLQAAPTNRGSDTQPALPDVGTGVTSASSQSVLHLPPGSAAANAAGSSAQAQLSCSLSSTHTANSDMIKRGATAGQGGEQAVAAASDSVPQL